MEEKIENILNIELMIEASYRMNIGFQEMTAFYQTATKSQIKHMEKIVKDNNWNAFKKLIKKVVNVELKG